jgi:phosphoglycolate phosphatase
MAKPKAIVFDLDGTLIHSAPDIQFAANEALKSIDRTPLDLPTIISFIGNGIEKLVERMLNATGGYDEPLRRVVLTNFLEIYSKNMTTLTKPYAGVVTVLHQLRSNDVLLGVCTNKPTEPAREICKQLDLAQYFDVIAGAEDRQPKKPDPQPLDACIAALGCRSEHVIYVGDSAIDYHTARNAGVAFRLFSGGYLNEPLPKLSPKDRFSSWDLKEMAIY